MDQFIIIVAILIGALVFLPVLVFLLVKFGTAAYFRERQKQKQQETNKQNEPID